MAQFQSSVRRECCCGYHVFLYDIQFFRKSFCKPNPICANFVCFNFFKHCAFSRFCWIWGFGRMVWILRKRTIFHYNYTLYASCNVYDSNAIFHFYIRKRCNFFVHGYDVLLIWVVIWLHLSRLFKIPLTIVGLVGNIDYQEVGKRKDR